MIDPLENFNPEAETTLFFMAEAQARGHRLFAFTLPGLSCETDSLWGEALEIKVLGVGKRPFYRVLQKKRVRLSDLDALFLRKDPPVDVRFIQHLYLLERLTGKVFMMNDPRAILAASEKVYPMKFSEFIPETCITSQWDRAARFAGKQKKGVILKPLNGAGGEGIFYARPGDSNLKVAFDFLSQNQSQYVVCQEYLPEVKRGDKRVLLLGGEILGYFLRIPQPGEHRANLHRGGRLKACSLTSEEKRISREVGRVLNEGGMSFVGLDFIGERLTEVNVTSPMGIREVNQTMKVKSEKAVIDFVESKVLK